MTRPSPGGGASSSSLVTKVAIAVIAVGVAVGAVVAARQKPSPQPLDNPAGGSSGQAQKMEGRTEPTVQAVAKLPRLLDLGATKCIPCKMMAPILEEMKKEYQGKLDVEFIDVWQNPDEGKKYGVESIPTQIFYDPDGKELFRHVGFFSKEEILSKWTEFGVDLGKGGSDEKTE